MKSLLILYVLTLTLTVVGQIPETSGYRGKLVGVAPYINTDYNFTVTPPAGTTRDEEFNQKANFLSTYKCTAPTCIVHGFFSVVIVKPLNATRSLVSETFQKESARDKMISSFVNKTATDSTSKILSNKYVEINGRPAVKVDYSFNQNAIPLISTMTVVFVEERKIVIAFGSLAENSQSEKWNKITDTAINSLTLLPARNTLTANLPPPEGIATGIITGKPGVIVAAPVDENFNQTILNYQATTLPKPDFPAAARAVRATGIVKVQVTVDGNGNVVSAAAISGHPLLQSASVKAARQAKFNPSATGDNLTGILIYNFEIPAPKP